VHFYANKTQLGPLGVAHGETSCICLPAVCKFNAAHNANRDRQAELRNFLMQDPVVAGVVLKYLDDIASADLGDILDAVIRELGMPRSLADVGIGRDKLEMLAENSLHDPLCQSNPVPLTEKSQVLEILEMVV
jgi:alcohol dehydrogenase class IV